MTTPILRKTVVDRVEIDRDGTLGVRIGLQLCQGDEVLSTAWHRTAIPSDVPPALQMAAVNQNLAEMGNELVSDEDIQKIVALHRVANDIE